MPKISDRIDRLEELDQHCGRRPPGMTIEEFVKPWGSMTVPQLQTYLRTISDEDLEAGVAYLQTVVAAEQEVGHAKT